MGSRDARSCRSRRTSAIRSSSETLREPSCTWPTRFSCQVRPLSSCRCAKSTTTRSVRASRARSHACSRRLLTTPSTVAPSAIASGSTWSRLHRSGPPAGTQAVRRPPPQARTVPDIELYDATLRDGMGGGGLSLTAQEKLRVVHALDDLGVHMIEAGFPASHPKEQELFGLLARERLRQAAIVGFGVTRPPGVAAAHDHGLALLGDP